jgi:hypothetical protein
LTAMLNSTNNNTSSNTQEVIFNSSNIQWANNSAISKLIASSTLSPISHTPIVNNNSSNYALSFDKFLKNEDDLTPNLLKSKEESAPNHVFNTYWGTHWSKSNMTHRYTNLPKINNYMNNSYMPTFHEYAEYDFKNWQALELLEDAFWESTYSAFSHDEYLNILQSSNDHFYFKKQEEIFNLSNRHKKI